MVSDINCLTVVRPCSPIDTITVGNDASLPILHIGDATLTLGSRVFHLRNVLHVSQLS